MRHIVWKPYWDFEKEEKWLNEMSQKGLALTQYTWCRYVFEDTPANQYIYRIELLKTRPENPEGKAYLDFLRESGIECVSTYMRWAYLRKKAVEGPFQIYTGISSIIKHYKRIMLLWFTLMLLELVTGAMNLSIGLMHYADEGRYNGLSYNNFVFGVCFIAIAFLFFRLGYSIRKKIKKLEKEKMIRE